MSLFGRAAGWLDSELAREREAVTDKLSATLSDLKGPTLGRRSIKELLRNSTLP